MKSTGNKVNLAKKIKLVTFLRPINFLIKQIFNKNFFGSEPAHGVLSFILEVKVN